MSYWLCFTAAVFLSKHEKFAGPNRASFLTLNNGAFFTMFLLTMLQVHHGGFWKFSLGYGVVLLDWRYWRAGLWPRNRSQKILTSRKACCSRRSG